MPLKNDVAVNQTARLFIEEWTDTIHAGWR